MKFNMTYVTYSNCHYPMAEVQEICISVLYYYFGDHSHCGHDWCPYHFMANDAVKKSKLLYCDMTINRKLSL